MMKKLKAAWVVIWWALDSMVFFAPISIAGLFGPSGRFAFRLCQGWTWWATVVCGVRLEIVQNPNVDPSRSYIIMSNHQSLFDIPALMLGLGLQFRWIIKKSFVYVPLFGWALWFARHVFIDRSNPKRSAISDCPKPQRRLAVGFLRQSGCRPSERLRLRQSGLA